MRASHITGVDREEDFREEALRRQIKHRGYHIWDDRCSAAEGRGEGAVGREIVLDEIHLADECCRDPISRAQAWTDCIH